MENKRWNFADICEINNINYNINYYNHSHTYVNVIHTYIYIFYLRFAYYTIIDVTKTKTNLTEFIKEESYSLKSLHYIEVLRTYVVYSF